MTNEQIEAAAVETDRLCRELDITNADHIALWLEANTDESSISWLAVRIIEAHEAAIATPPDRYAEGYAAAKAQAVGVCREQEASFASEEYATGQPLSSMTERFACKMIAQGIATMEPGA